MLTPTDFREIESEVSRIYSDIETDLVRAICRYVAKHEGDISIEEWRARKNIGWSSFKLNLEKIASTDSRKISKQIDTLVEKVINKNNASDQKLIKAIHEYKKDTEQEVKIEPTQIQKEKIRAIIENAKNGINLTNTRAITNSQRIFESAVNRAYIEVVEGNQTLSNAVAKATKQLAREGITVASYGTSGRPYQMSIDAVVRRNVVTSVSQATSQMTLETAQQNDCDLVKTSAHLGARPEHYLWQGKVFSISGTSDKYPYLSDPQESGGTGYGTAEGLCGCNCRHFFFPYVEGFNPASYGIEDVTESENEEVYQATQKQRYLEREVRSWKRVLKVSQDQKNANDINTANLKIQEYESRIKLLTTKYGIPRQKEREDV
jgi:hypothetical protein|nr:MAG TPA_asm: minor capsid protein [Caudoviricetes sp.]